MNPDSSASNREVLVIGYGNQLRRDDGLGPKLAAAIEQLALPVVRVLTCHQLTPELAEPISRARAVIFLDAAADPTQGVQVQALTLASPQQVVGHTAQPSGLLGLAASLFGRQPQGWWITLPAFDLSYGEGLSERAQSALSAGLDAFRQLLAHSSLLRIVFSFLVLSQSTPAAPDVTFWAVRQTGTTAHLRGVTYDSQRFVVVGDQGTILTSAGGSWEKVETGVTNDFTGIAWGNGNFVAVGTAGALLSSTNGITWTQRNSAMEEKVRCITFGNEAFVALASTNSLTSKDGLSWSKHPVPLMSPESVCYGNGRFVSVGGRSVLSMDGEIRESVDGQSWRLWPQGQCVYHDVLFAEGYFTAVGEGMGTHFIQHGFLWRAPGVVEQGGAAYFSEDNMGSYHGIAFGDGLFVTVGGAQMVPNAWWVGKIATSPTGANPWASQDQIIDPWPQTYFQLQNLLLDVAFGAGKFVAVGENGTLVESGTAARFDPRQTRIEANGQFQFAVLSPAGSRVQIESSPDFQTWSTVLAATNSSGTLIIPVTPSARAGFMRANLLVP